MRAKLSVQTENPKVLEEAINSSCDSIRFGPEFCMWKIPNIDALKDAYTLAERAKKGFTYVSPRLSDSSLRRVTKHLDFLELKGETGIVINDFGMLNILEHYKNLRPYLGRQLTFVPARCPWPELPGWDAGYLERRRVKALFYQMSLNFEPSIRFFQSYGVRGVDLDLIPECFPYFNFLVKHGLNLSIHLFLVPVAITRRCHTARFLDKESPEECSRPCDEKTFLLKQDMLGVELLLGGNVVYKRSQPSKRELEKLKNVEEFIITMSPATGIRSREKIDEVTKNLGLA